MKPNHILTLLALTLLAGQSQAQIQGQLGILTAETLAGNNPATGAPWAIGDTYHLTYLTTSTTDATSTDIADYNAFVQTDATAGGMGAASWYVMGSTATTNAIDNAVITGPVINVFDQGIVAIDSSDLWDLDFSTSAHPTTLTGGEANVHFGTKGGGTAQPGVELGATGGSVRIEWSAWINWAAAWRGEGTSTLKPLVAISQELKIVGPSQPFPLTITPNDPDSRFQLVWKSQGGMLYNVRSSTDLSAPISTWTLVEGDVEATPPSNTKNVDPTETSLFYAVEEYPAPPVTVFEEYFDTTTGPGLPTGWSTGRNDPPDDGTISATDWEVGTPANVGPVPPSTPLPSGTQCVATDIGSDYYQGGGIGVPTTDIWLRTPAINLGSATAGTLSFQQWTEIEQEIGDLDYGSIRILDGSDTLLETLENRTIDGATSGWEEYSAALPAAVFNATGDTIIKVEFRFEADDYPSASTFAGWYIDDVVVTTPAP